MFHDDVHYIDGLLHLDEYALMIDHLNALPPAPDYPLDEETLAARFDSEPWLLSWLGQQQDGPYWRRASLRPDYCRLTVPAFLIGGWYDGYRDSISADARLLPGAGQGADRPVEPHVSRTTPSLVPPSSGGRRRSAGGITG